MTPMAKRGRPRKPGERYSCGKLKHPSDEDEFSEVAWKRFKDALRCKRTEDRYAGSQLGRLGVLNTLTHAEVRAGFKVGAIYGRYERSLNIRRTTQSPTYVSAFTGSSPHAADDDDT